MPEKKHIIIDTKGQNEDSHKLSLLEYDELEYVVKLLTNLKKRVELSINEVKVIDGLIPKIRGEILNNYLTKLDVGF
jgi:hypothetical protein